MHYRAEMVMKMASVMTTREAAEYLRTSEDSIKRFARAGRIPAAKLGRAWRFVKDDLDRWLAGGGTASEPDVDAWLIERAKERLMEPRFTNEQMKAALGL